jgi:hypothetical protein
MSHEKLLLLQIASILIYTSTLNAQTIWTGATMTFTKANNTDYNLEVNQDRITNNVWITRGNSGGGIYNIATENSYIRFISPSDTEWAFGVTANLGSLTFGDFQQTHGSNAPSIVNQDMVVHLITEDIYIDIKFTSWTEGPENGGGFSFVRSTNQNLGITESKINNKLKIYPNPSRDFMKISGLTEVENYKVYNLLGCKVMEGTISNNQILNIQNMIRGLYIIEFDEIGSMKFIKN